MLAKCFNDALGPLGRPSTSGVATHLNARDLGGSVGSVDDQLRHLLAGDEVQVRAVLRRRVVGLASRAPGDGLRVDVVGAVVATDWRTGCLVGWDGDAKLVRGIDNVYWARSASFWHGNGGGGRLTRGGPEPRRVADLDVSILAVHAGVGLDRVLREDSLVRSREDLRLLEVRQEAVPAPAIVAQSLPAIEVGLGAAVKDHAVQLRRATHDPALGDGHGTVAQLRARGVGRVPVILGANGAAGHSWDGDIVLVLVAVEKLLVSAGVPYLIVPFELQVVQHQLRVQ